MSAPSPCSILVVEDERIVAHDIQETLRELGYDAFAIASSADEAIAFVTERCPDLVLMDIRIKGERDGIETAQILKRDFGVAVVYLTAYADDATLARARLTEPFGYLVKPVKAAELRGAIEVSLYKHEMEKRLRARERWFHTTLRSIADAVVTVDLAGMVTFMNPAAEQLTAVKAANAIGRPASEIVRLTSGHLPFSPLELALARGAVVQIQEAELTSSRSESRTISDSAAPVVDDGKTLGAVMVFRDITEQKLLEKRLEMSDRLASLGTMAAGIAHEVNNPLAVIVGNASFVHDQLAQLLLALEHEGTPSSTAIANLREALSAQAEVQSSAERIRQIVAELRTFSRPPPLVAAHADVERAIDWALKMTAHELRSRARVVKSTEPVPPVALDETRLGQVLINLLVNAAHAIGPGDAEHNEVAISARVTTEERVVIEVRDSGCGMTPEVQKLIFEPFFTTKPVGVGTGLGLSICHGIAASVGGSLQVESSVDHGSVFRLVLPAASVEQETPRVTTPPIRAEDVRRRRVLVVDDEEMILRTLKRLLDDHEVVCVDSARKALKLLETEPAFDVILSDISMPDMTGMDFYETLLGKHPDVARHVVFLSGGALDPRVADFLAVVPNTCLEKPFEAARLKAVVQHMARPRE
jgi:two-component system, cell cycle sensor histidine kinase and response regulator CckA